MEDARPVGRRMLLLVVLVPILVGAALWLPDWWEKRELHAAQALAGVGSQILPGSITDARKKIDPGMTAEKITAAIGKPSFLAGTAGEESKHEIWAYYYSDGTMKVNLTDGIAVRISTEYGKPFIPKVRPE